MSTTCWLVLCLQLVVGWFLNYYLDSVASLDFLLRDGFYNQDMVGVAYSCLVWKLFATMCQWEISSALCIYLWRLFI